jgi:hypothetical protein
MTATARIYKPAKTAMQSGTAASQDWHLEFDVASARFIEPLMGWTGSRDTRGQVVLSFPSKAAAIAFAEKNGLSYVVEEPQTRRPVRRSYADNFAFDRRR